MLATFSNYQKIDPIVFSVWASILRRVPKAVFWILRHNADAVSSTLECCPAVMSQ